MKTKTGIESILKSYTAKLKSYDVPYTSYTQSVTCSLQNILYDNVYVSNPPHIKNPINNGNFTHLNYITDKEEYISFTNTVNNVIKWVSDLKVYSSTFNNYLWSHLCEKDKQLPEITDTYFTQLFSTLYGNNTEYTEIYNEFKKEYSITQDFPVMSRVSQIMCHVKNELTTVCTNNITLNFENRILSVISWRVLDLFENLKFDKDFKWTTCVNEVTTYIFSCLKKNTPINIDHINVKYKIGLNNTKIKDLFEIDQKMFKTMKINNMDSRKNTLAKKKEENVEKTLSFESALKTNPQNFVKYFYYSEKIIDGLVITEKYNKIIDEINEINTLIITEEEKKKKKKNYWETNWKWGMRSLPKFKLMPLNAIKKHFIRIDKKMLQEWKLVCITEVDMKNNMKNIKKPSKDYIKYKGIQYDCFGNDIYMNETNCIKVRSLNESDNKWWCDSIIDVYNKETNIRELRRERDDMRSFKQVKNYVDTLVKDQFHNFPWIPGASFLTDGVQLKLPILTVRTPDNDRTSGLKKLFERGYSSLGGSKVVKLDNKENGIFHYNNNITLGKTPRKDCVFIGVDPGRNKPLSVSFIEGNELPLNYKNKKRIKVVDKSIESNSYITNEYYRTLIGALEQNNYEKLRRTGSKYGKALEQFKGTCKKSCLINKMSNYIKIRLETWEAISKELYRDCRTISKFKYYSKSQSAVSKCIKKLLEKVPTNKKKIIFFGNGTFSAGGSGYGSVPKKRFIREMGVKDIVIITNEYNTSKLSPLNLMEHKKEKDTSLRLRQCITENEERTDVLKYLNKKHDRDALGSVGICQKGFYELIGREIIEYKK